MGVVIKYDASDMDWKILENFPDSFNKVLENFESLYQ